MFCKCLYAFAFAGVVVALLVLGGTNERTDAQQEPGNKPTQADSTKPAPKTTTREGPIPTPPPRAASEQKFTVVSMAEAVTIAEKVGKGYTTRAERIERPTIGFSIDVVAMNGTKNTIELTGDGKVVSKKGFQFKGKKRGK